MTTGVTISISAPIINTMAIFLSHNRGEGLVNEMVSYLVETYSNNNVSTFIKHIKDNKVVKNLDKNKILKKITLELIQQFREDELYSLLQSNPQLFEDKEITKNLLENIESFSSSCCVNISLLMLSLDDDEHKLSILEKISTADRRIQEKFVKMLRHQNIEFDFFQFSPRRQKDIIKTLSLYQGKLNLTERYTQYLADIASRKITGYKHFEKETRDNIAKLNFTCRKAFLEGLLESTKALHSSESKVITFAQGLCQGYKDSEIELTTNTYLSCVAAYLHSSKPKREEKRESQKTIVESANKIVHLDSVRKQKNAKLSTIFSYNSIMRKNRFLSSVFNSSLEKSLLKQTKKIHAKVARERGYAYSTTTVTQRKLLRDHVLKLIKDIKDIPALKKLNEETIIYSLYELIKNRAKFTTQQRDTILSLLCTNPRTPHGFLYEIATTTKNNTLTKIIHESITGTQRYRSAS